MKKKKIIILLLAVMIGICAFNYKRILLHHIITSYCRKQKIVNYEIKSIEYASVVEGYSVEIEVDGKIRNLFIPGKYFPAGVSYDSELQRG